MALLVYWVHANFAREVRNWLDMIPVNWSILLDTATRDGIKIVEAWEFACAWLIYVLEITTSYSAILTWNNVQTCVLYQYPVRWKRPWSGMQFQIVLSRENISGRSQIAITRIGFWPACNAVWGVNWNRYFCCLKSPMKAFNARYRASVRAAVLAVPWRGQTMWNNTSAQVHTQ